MGILVASTVSGITNLQKFDEKRYQDATSKLSDAIGENAESADQAYIDLNFAVLYFENAASAIETYKIIRSECISNAIALSSVMYQGEFDISIKRPSKKIIVKHGEHSRRLRQGLRLFKGIGIRLPDSFPDLMPKSSAESVPSVFLPIAGSHSLVNYLDLRYDSDPKKCRSMFLLYLDSTKGADNYHSRYYVPLIINLIRGLNDNEFIINPQKDQEFLAEFIDATKKPVSYRRALGYGAILAVVVDKISLVENSEKKLKDRLGELFSTAHARKIIKPYLHDNRVLSHQALSALVKFNLVH